jgi:hypothetical protein
MKSWELSRALTICITTASLAACGGRPGSTYEPPAITPDRVAHHQTFHYTGIKQVFTVPALVSRIRVIAFGAAGGGVVPRFTGRGGRVSAIIPVTPGEKLIVYVGGAGGPGVGGFNGGANSGTGVYQCIYCTGYGGGGATDIRQNGDSLRDRILVVGGGGGEAGLDTSNGGPPGGKGGESIGGAGGMKDYGGGGGGGGSQRRGGRGGSLGCGESQCGGRGSPGSVGEAGTGGAAAPYSFYSGAAGGGGGGGYYGGGGGGGDGGGALSGFYAAAGGGGGGGSTYIEPSATHVHSSQGWYRARGNGVVVFIW